MKFIWKDERGIVTTFKTEDVYWTTGAKNEIPIASMDDDHLTNTIDYIERRKDRACSFNGDLKFILYAMKQEDMYRSWRNYKDEQSEGKEKMSEVIYNEEVILTLNGVSAKGMVFKYKSGRGIHDTVIFFDDNKLIPRAWEIMEDGREEERKLYTDRYKYGYYINKNTITTTRITTKTTTKKETKIMEHKDIELKSDLTKTLTQNMAVKMAYEKMQEIEEEAEKNIEINESYQTRKDNIDEKMEEIAKASKELDTEYDKQTAIIEAITKTKK